MGAYHAFCCRVRSESVLGCVTLSSDPYVVCCAVADNIVPPFLSYSFIVWRITMLVCTLSCFFIEAGSGTSAAHHNMQQSDVAGHVLRLSYHRILLRNLTSSMLSWEDAWDQKYHSWPASYSLQRMSVSLFINPLPRREGIWQQGRLRKGRLRLPWECLPLLLRSPTLPGASRCPIPLGSPAAPRGGYRVE
jgi:hypothetical protein